MSTARVRAKGWPTSRRCSRPLGSRACMTRERAATSWSRIRTHIARASSATAPTSWSAALRDLRNAGVYTGFGDEWVRIGRRQVRGRRVGLRADDADEHAVRGKPDDYGILTMSQEEIHEGLADRRRREDGPSAVTGSVFVTWRVPPAPSGPSPPAFRRPRRRAPRGTTARALRHAPRGGSTRARAAAGT